MTPETALISELADQRFPTRRATPIAGFNDADPDPRHHKSPLRQLIVETNSSFKYRYATNFHIGYPHGLYSLEELLTDKGLHRSWALWHELGHQRQQVWTWPALAETTVNIFSLAVLRATPDVPPTTPSVHHGTVHEWDDAWTWLKRPLAERDFNCVPPTDNNNPACPYSLHFTRLTMFEQLRVVFGDTWIRQVHRITRVERPRLADDAAKRMYFMTTACKAASTDLSAYFTAWAIPGSTNACAGLKLRRPAGDLTTVATYGAGTLLTTDAQPSGTVTLAAPGGRYGAGAKVIATARPAPGYRFTRWLLDGKPADSPNPRTVTMDTAHTLTAVFTPPTPPTALPVVQEVSRPEVLGQGSPIGSKSGTAERVRGTEA
ncbi:M60 family metallopeptidase [Streptomyces olivoreticuli]